MGAITVEWENVERFFTAEAFPDGIIAIYEETLPQDELQYFRAVYEGLDIERAFGMLGDYLASAYQVRAGLEGTPAVYFFSDKEVDFLIKCRDAHRPLFVGHYDEPWLIKMVTLEMRRQIVNEVTNKLSSLNDVGRTFINPPEELLYRRDRGAYLQSIIDIDRVNTSETEVESEILLWWEKIAL